jgi:hypothetical protein
MIPNAPRETPPIAATIRRSFDFLLCQLLFKHGHAGFELGSRNHAMQKIAQLRQSSCLPCMHVTGKPETDRLQGRLRRRAVVALSGIWKVNCHSAILPPPNWPQRLGAVGIALRLY